MLGHDTGFMLNGDHVGFYGAIKERFLRGLAPQLKQIRLGIAEHIGVDPERVVMGGDPGTIIEDMFPAGIIVRLPHVVQSYFLNPHFDKYLDADQIKNRLPSCKDSRMVGFTLMLQMPSDGAALWWWQFPTPAMYGRTLLFAEEYKVGHFVSVHEDMLHSIAPWEMRLGWLDPPRVTMQMFALRCDGVFYVFH